MTRGQSRPKCFGAGTAGRIGSRSFASDWRCRHREIAGPGEGRLPAVTPPPPFTLSGDHMPNIKVGFTPTATPQFTFDPEHQHMQGVGTMVFTKYWTMRHWDSKSCTNSNIAGDQS